MLLSLYKNKDRSIPTYFSAYIIDKPDNSIDPVQNVSAEKNYRRNDNHPVIKNMMSLNYVS